MHPAGRIRGIKAEILMGKKIVLGVTGSIAAVETVKLIRELIRYGADVYPVMTPAAQRIIHPDALYFASGHRPVTELTGAVEHVELCGEDSDTDLLLIAPATANTISKIAMGIDDTPVTTFATTAIGSRIPVLIVPAMHGSMYKHPKILENIITLNEMHTKGGAGGDSKGNSKEGLVRVTSVKNEEGKAKLLDTEEIVAEVVRLFVSGNEKSRGILVIAGATEEPIDDMRVITNRATGKTGLYLAEWGIMLGHNVELWLGRSTSEIPSIVRNLAEIRRYTTVKSLLEMIKNGKRYDIVLIPAAISDYSPEKVEGKIPSGKGELELRLRGTPKVISQLKGIADILVGFKAESIPPETPDSEKEKLLVGRAGALMESSGADMVVANNLNEVSENRTEAMLVFQDSVEMFSGDKKDLAHRIILESLSLHDRKKNSG